MTTLTARQYLTRGDIAQMAEDAGVSPREFLERLLANQDQHFRELMDERDRRYEQRFEAQEKAVVAALTAATESTRVALEAATEATNKFERQEEEWRRNANEWRGAMGDREKQFVSRSEQATSEKNQGEKIESLAERVAAIELSADGTGGIVGGRDKTWDLILTMVPILVSIAGVVLVLVLNN